MGVSTKNPGDLTVGTGLAGARSVDIRSQVSPTQHLTGLTAHVRDPSRAHMASAVGVSDSAEYFRSDEVEGVLAEVGLGVNQSFQNGVLSGGGFVSAGLDITLSDTLVRLGFPVDVTGQVVTLTDGATNWVYINLDGTLVADTTMPLLTTEENVLLWKVVTSGGSVVSSTDARFFVTNIDRKLPYVVRSTGTDVDKYSEACFVSLDAAFLWLGLYSYGFAHFTLVIRGSVTVSNTMLIPVSGLTIEGENGKIETGAVNLNPVFDLNGCSYVTFRNLTFMSQHSGCTAIADASGHSDYVTIEHCYFDAGGGIWETGIRLTDGSAVNKNHVIRDVSIASSVTGVDLYMAEDCLLSHLSLAGIGVGIQVQATSNTVVSDSSLYGYAEPFVLEGSGITIRDSYCEGATTGVSFNACSYSTLINLMLVMSDVDQTGVMRGLSLNSGQSINITGCRIVNPRVGWSSSSDNVLGIEISTGVSYVSVSHVYLEGWYNTNASIGDGVSVAAGASNIHLTDVQISTVGTAVVLDSDQSSVCNVDITGATEAVRSASDGAVFDSLQVSLHASRGVYGATLTGNRVKVQNCFFECSSGLSSYGISLGGDGCCVSSNSFSGFSSGGAGTGVVVGSSGNRIVHNRFAGCFFSIELFDGASSNSIEGNYMVGTTGAGSRGISISGSAADPTLDVIVQGNTIKQNAEAGIYCEGAVRNLLCSGNQIDMGLAVDIYNPSAHGILVYSSGTDTLDGCVVSNNTISRCLRGVVLKGGVNALLTNISIVGNVIHHCGFSQDLSVVPADTFEAGGSCGIGLCFVSNANVSDNTMFKIGILVSDAGVENFPVSAFSYVQSKAIYVRNSTHVALGLNTIKDTVSQNLAVPGATRAQGHGIYVEVRSTGKGSIWTSEAICISDNTIEWETGLAGNLYHDSGVTCSVASGTDVTDNTLSQLQIQANTIVRPGRNGVDLVVSGGGVLTGASIDNNRISDTNPDALTPVSMIHGAIILQNVAGSGSDPVIQYVSLNGNKVTGANAPGIRVYATMDGTYTDIAMHQNQIYDVLSFALGISVTAAVTAATLGRFSFAGNLLDASSQFGVLFDTSGSGTAANVSAVQVSNNVISNTSTGVYFQNLNGNSYNVLIQGNQLNVCDTSLHVNCSNAGGTCNTLQFLGNSMFSNASAETLHAQIAGDAYGLVCSGNVVTASQQEGIYIDVGGNIYGCDLSHNTVSDHNVSAGAGLAGIQLDCAGGVSALSVVGNAVYSTHNTARGLEFNLYGAVTESSWTGNNARVHGGPFMYNASTTGSQNRVSFIGNNMYRNSGTNVVSHSGSGFAPTYSICVNNTSNAGSAADGWDTAGGTGFASTFNAGNTTTTGNWT